MVDEVKLDNCEEVEEEFIEELTKETEGDCRKFDEEFDEGLGEEVVTMLSLVLSCVLFVFETIECRECNIVKI